MTAAEQAAWAAALPPLAGPHRVSKDTIVARVEAAGALPAVMAALAAQSPEQQFVWTHSGWFWSTNETLRGLCAALGLDPAAILGPDPYL